MTLSELGRGAVRFYPSPSGFDEGPATGLLSDHLDSVVIALPDGRIVGANERMCALVGHDHETLAEMTFGDLFHSGERDHLAAQLASAVDGESARFRTGGRTATGGPFFVEVTALPWRNGAGEVVAVRFVVRDVSELLQVVLGDDRVAGRERMLQDTLDQMATAVVFFDREWRYTYFNEVAKRYIPRFDDAIGRPLWEATPEIMATPFAESLRTAMIDRVVTRSQGFADGAGRWLEVNAYPTDDGVALYLTDVTAEHEAKAHLDEQEQQLRAQAALIDASRDAIYVRDLEHRITFWSRGAEAMYGWSREEALGRTTRELIYRDPAIFDGHNTRLMERGEWDAQMEHVTREGRRMVADCRWQVLRDEGGAATSVLCVVSDITEHRIEQDREFRAQRMESLGTLAGGIAHDLNNVLTPILISSQLLAADEPEGVRSQLLESIEASAKRGADMVRQVLYFARGQDVERSLVDVTTLMEQVHLFSRDTLPKSIRLSTEYPSRLWKVMGDSTQLLQVLMNLVTNARDAMPDGGDLTIRARDLDARGETDAQGDGLSVIIEVEDSGSGMDAETVCRVFEPFFTTKELGSGTGLGLSTSMAIIRGHSGNIEVYSEPGRGTRFRIRLPAAVTETGEARPPEPDLHGNGETVLVADDETVIRGIVEQALAAHGYTAVVASSGVEALAMIERGDPKIDLVLTDMMMPGLGGAAIAAYLAEHQPTLPVVAASGLIANADVARAAHAGIRVFLSKPYTTGEMLRAIRTALDSREDGVAG